MNRLPSLRRMAALGLLGALAAGSVSAHITLAERTAPSGGYARVTLQVPHGCSGRELRRAMQPRHEHGSRRERVCFAREIAENLLSDVLG